MAIKKKVSKLDSGKAPAKDSKKPAKKEASKAAAKSAKPKAQATKAKPVAKDAKATKPGKDKPAKAAAAKPQSKAEKNLKKEPEKAIKALPKTAADKKRDSAQAALEAALNATSGKGGDEDADEEEFDPAAFYAASGVTGPMKSHVMRKERVELGVVVRYRFLKGPLVYNAELLNLSKGGLCLKTPSIVKPKTVIRIEIPLPHTSELFAVQAEVIWSVGIGEATGDDQPIHTGLRFMPMSLAKQAVISQFIQQRRDEVIMSKIGLDRFKDSVPVAGLD